MGNIWYVTSDRVAVDWTTAVTGPNKEKLRAQVDIYRVTRGGFGDVHEQSQLWAKTGSAVGYWAFIRAQEEQSLQPVPAALPLPSSSTSAGGGGTSLTTWSQVPKPAGGIPVTDIDVMGLADADAFRDRF
jgi:hypothetical protein